MNYELANDYINDAKAFNAFAYVAFSVAIIMLIVTILTLNYWLIILAIIFFALGFAGRTSKVTDAQYDELIATIKVNTLENALEKLGINQEQLIDIEPITRSGYGRDNCKSRTGLDGRVRTNKYLVTYLIFSQKQVYYYSCVTITTFNSVVDNTHTCMYKDIVSVITDTDADSSNENARARMYLRLVTCGGSSIKLPISNTAKIQQDIAQLRTIISNSKA